MALWAFFLFFATLSLLLVCRDILNVLSRPLLVWSGLVPCVCQAKSEEFCLPSPSCTVHSWMQTQLVTGHACWGIRSVMMILKIILECASFDLEFFFIYHSILLLCLLCRSFKREILCLHTFTSQIASIVLCNSVSPSSSWYIQGLSDFCLVLLCPTHTKSAVHSHLGKKSDRWQEISSSPVINKDNTWSSVTVMTQTAW